jgi:hypothetical protein
VVAAADWRRAASTVPSRQGLTVEYQRMPLDWLASSPTADPVAHNVVTKNSENSTRLI